MKQKVSPCQTLQGYFPSNRMHFKTEQDAEGGYKQHLANTCLYTGRLLVLQMTVSIVHV